MEYSVYDLIRILLKKWYVILLVMALLGGAAGVFSQRSYQAALADYEDYTSRAAPVNTEVGSYTAVYQCGFTVTDFSRYQGQYEPAVVMAGIDLQRLFKPLYLKKAIRSRKTRALLLWLPIIFLPVPTAMVL